MYDWDLATARHECGHALAALLVGGRFRYVTLRPRSRGNVAHVAAMTAPTPFDLAAVLWAGIVVDGDFNRGAGDIMDLDRLRREVPYAMAADGSGPRAEAERLLTDQSDLLDHLAVELVRRRTLTQREFLRAIGEWQRSLGTSWAHASEKR